MALYGCLSGLGFKELATNCVEPSDFVNCGGLRQRRQNKTASAGEGVRDKNDKCRGGDDDDDDDADLGLRRSLSAQHVDGKLVSKVQRTRTDVEWITATLLFYACPLLFWRRFWLLPRIQNVARKHLYAFGFGHVAALVWPTLLFNSWLCIDHLRICQATSGDNAACLLDDGALRELCLQWTGYILCATAVAVLHSVVFESGADQWMLMTDVPVQLAPYMQKRDITIESTHGKLAMRRSAVLQTNGTSLLLAIPNLVLVACNIRSQPAGQPLRFLYWSGALCSFVCVSQLLRQMLELFERLRFHDSMLVAFSKATCAFTTKGEFNMQKTDGLMSWYLVREYIVGFHRPVAQAAQTYLGIISTLIVAFAAVMVAADRGVLVLGLTGWQQARILWDFLVLGHCVYRLASWTIRFNNHRDRHLEMLLRRRVVAHRLLESEALCQVRNMYEDLIELLQSTDEVSAPRIFGVCISNDSIKQGLLACAIGVLATIVDDLGISRRLLLPGSV